METNIVNEGDETLPNTLTGNQIILTDTMP